MTARYAEPSDVKLREESYVTRTYIAKTGEGEDLAMVQDPGFWIMIAKFSRVRDVIEVIADNGAWEWHGRVTHKGTGEVFLRQTYLWERPDGTKDAETTKLAGEYKVAWAGRAHKWRITDPAGNVVKHSFDDEGQARDWLRQYQAGEIRAAA